MVYVGVDLHKTQFTVCVLCGDKRRHKVYRCDEAGYEAFLDDIRAQGGRRSRIELAVETVGNVWYFVKRIEKHVGKIEVVNTMKFKVIAESTKKTDRNDAEQIAFYLKKGMLPTVVLPDERSRQIAKYVKIRDRYVKIKTRMKNQIHGILTEEGLEVKTIQLTSRKKLKGLLELEINEVSKYLVKVLVEDLSRLMERVAELERKLKEFVKGDKVVELLMTIPGTGPISACAVRAIIADIDRFDHPKKVSAYAGLVPWVSNSNEKVRHGHITKHGSTILRNAFVQMAVGLIRNKDKLSNKSMELYAWYKRTFHRVGGGKSKIALARKMTTIVWAMLTNNQAFNYGA